MKDEMIDSIPDVYLALRHERFDLKNKIEEMRNKCNDFNYLLDENEILISNDKEEKHLNKDKGELYINYKNCYLNVIFVLEESNNSFISFWFDFNVPGIQISSIKEDEYRELLFVLYDIFKPVFLRTAWSIEDGAGVLYKNEVKDMEFQQFHWIQILSRDVSNFEKVDEITSDPRIEKKYFNDGESIFLMLKEFTGDFLIELENKL